MMGWGYGNGFLAMMGGMFFVVIWLMCFAVGVAVIFLLVRFLLIGTRAAQLYISKNEPPRPVAPAVAPVVAPAVVKATAPAHATTPAPAPVKAAASQQTPSVIAKPTTTAPALAKSAPTTRKAPAKPQTSVPRTPKAAVKPSPKGAPKKP